MAELKVVLEQLADALPTLPEKMTEVVQEGADLDKRADEFLQHMDQMRAEAQGLFEQVKDALDDLKKEDEAEQTQLLEAMRELEDAAEQTIKSINEWTEGGLKVAIQTAGTAMGELQDMIKLGGEEAQSAKDDFEQGVDEVRAKASEGQQSLQNALEAASNEMESLRGKLDDAKSQLESDVDNLSSEIQSTQDAISSQVQELMDGASAIKDALDGDMKTIIQDIVQSKTAELLDELKSRIAEEVKNVMDTAVNEVKDTLGGLTEKIMNAKEGQEGARAALEPLFDMVEELTSPLTSAIDSIKDAASMVGIDFD